VRTLPYPLNRFAGLGYRLDLRPKALTLVGVRMARNTPGAVDDLLWAFRTDATDGRLIARIYPLETEPSVPFLLDPVNKAGAAVMAPQQARAAYRRGLHRGRPALVQVGPVVVYRDNDRDSAVEVLPARVEEGFFGINIHDIRGDLAGCQGLYSGDLAELLALADEHTAAGFGDLDYTLLEAF
jgi:hypothetical protein